MQDTKPIRTFEEVEAAVDVIRADYGVHPRETGAFNVVASRLTKGDCAGAINRLDEIIDASEKRTAAFRSIRERIMAGYRKDYEDNVQNLY